MIFSHHHSMKCKSALLVGGLLLLMPIKASGQPSDVEVVGPTPFGVAEPAKWRDGYINWRGRKIFAPDWRTFRSDNTETFVVDMKSIVNIDPNGTLVRVVAYLVEGDDYDPKRLIQFAFNCKDFVEVVTAVSFDRLRPVQEKARKLACR
jgi:hypothetical protein